MSHQRAETAEENPFDNMFDDERATREEVVRMLIRSITAAGIGIAHLIAIFWFDAPLKRCQILRQVGTTAAAARPATFRAWSTHYLSIGNMSILHHFVRRQCTTVLTHALRAYGPAALVSKPSTATRIAVAAASIPLIRLVLCPLDAVSTVMLVKQLSIRGAVSDIWRRRGIRGFFSGYFVGIAAEAAVAAKVIGLGHWRNRYVRLLEGFVVGAVVTHPADTWCRRAVLRDDAEERPDAAAETAPGNKGLTSLLQGLEWFAARLLFRALVVGGV